MKKFFRGKRVLRALTSTFILLLFLGSVGVFAPQLYEGWAFLIILVSCFILDFIVVRVYRHPKLSAYFYYTEDQTETETETGGGVG